jgi:tetratricopeptide (TPR) repeat protein
MARLMPIPAAMLAQIRAARFVVVAPGEEAIEPLRAELAAQAIEVVVAEGGVAAWLGALRDAAGEEPEDDVWVGAAARARGDAAGAEAAFRRAVIKEPRHEAALQALAELAAERGAWHEVIDHKRALAEVVEDDRRARLHEQIGDVWTERLGEPAQAIAAYLRALALAPARGLLHKLLEAFTAERAWARAIEMLERLALEEPAAERRARFHYAAAVIARDELDDAALAEQKLVAALDDAPLTPHAFAALDQILAARGDPRGLARAYRRQLKRVADVATAAQQVELWTRLGEICLEQLADREAATAAFQVAAELAPDEPDRHEQLVELYLAAGDVRRREAIVELHWLLARAPGRVELYKALAPRYLAEGELDKAWCVCQVLVALGAAAPAERALFERHRGARLALPARRLTDELWAKAIAHGDEDPAIGAALAGAALASPQPAAAFGATARIEPDADDRPVARAVAAIADVLALDPAPGIWLADGDGLRVAPLVAGAAGERARPALLIGALAPASERTRAFEIAKRLAYLRPERLAAVAVPSAARLEAAVAAARAAGDAALPDRPGAAAAWRGATDLTANRAGFVVCGDLETAARAIAREGATLSGLATKERLLDLLGFAASEGYFAIRRHLGQQLRREDA